MVLKKYNLAITLVLFVVNIVFTLFLIEELMDATEPNNGQLGLLTPFIAVIALLYIRGIERKTVLIRLLQVVNWVFIIFPVAVIAYGAMIMIGY